MEFTSVIAFLALSAAALVALPVAANTPVQLYHRAACNSHENGVLDELTRTRNVLRQLEDQYYHVARNPLLGPNFNRAKESLHIIIVETKDEVGDPIPKRSSGPALKKWSQSRFPTYVTTVDNWVGEQLHDLPGTPARAGLGALEQ
ncbi:hypothetical protein KI688_004488 [Linnemannia hyalina]|uniref:Uncharacterized protein n=1 Tax=Linnemannia hyalina TaxID=64524 RepID=A0A9P7XN79_9FUNG|nr:hypothetical protein KI688_004488 [Linnemannia hyalina]